MKKRNFTRSLVWNLLLLIPGTAALAQRGGPAIEQWRSFLPYNQATGAATDGSNFFVGTVGGFYTYNRDDGSLSAYSKSNGMSDIGIAAVGHDRTTKQTVIAYTNSNIDLFKDNSFYNIPELKLLPAGNKTIYHIQPHNGLAYLSTSLGLVVLNLNKREIKETIKFNDTTVDATVYASAILNDSIYVATSVGLLRSHINNPYILFEERWDAIGEARPYRHLASTGSRLYAAVSDSLFEIQGNTVSWIGTTAMPVKRLDAGNNGLWICAADPENETGYFTFMNAGHQRSDSFATKSPTQVLQLANGDVWYTDDSRYIYTTYHGFRKRTGTNTSEAFYPDGPVTNTSFDVSAYNGEVWVAHGSKSNTWDALRNRANFSRLKDDHWINTAWVDENPWVQDFIRIHKDQQSGKLYAASFGGGLLEMQPTGNWQIFNEGYLSRTRASTPGNDLYQVSGIAVDSRGNVWMTNFGADENELAVKTADGKWPKLKPIPNNSHSAADVIIDDYDQKWFICPSNEGAVVYDDNGTPENTSDDKYFALKKGKGAGGLPDNSTLSIAKDKDGAIWIGTTNGIGIVNCPDEVIARRCEAELKIVQADQFADHLFSQQSVKAIAVDGANRKWIGTSNGVWLISPDAEETIYRFTESNSPLPSNNIERINIDPVTGDVYFSTEKGLASFRSTATDGKAEHEEELFVYPNPVPSGFNGMIGVRGMAENADVRITDISGQLIYRTRALGGQAVWNGKDYNGRKAQSGVYLVFSVNKDGTQKATAKIILHE
jgi:hypothetical protein